MAAAYACGDALTPGCLHASALPSETGGATHLLDFLEQHAIRHELDSGLFGHVPFVSDLIGDDPVGPGQVSPPEVSLVGAAASWPVQGWQRRRPGPSGWAAKGQDPQEGPDTCPPALPPRREGEGSWHGQLKSMPTKHERGRWLEPD